VTTQEIRKVLRKARRESQAVTTQEIQKVLRKAPQGSRALRGLILTRTPSDEAPIDFGLDEYDGEEWQRVRGLLTTPFHTVTLRHTAD